MEGVGTKQAAASSDQEAPLTTEGKVLLAAEQAGQIASIFSPAAGAAVNAGVAVEPLVSGIVRLIIGLFHHHTGVAPAAATAAK